MWFWVTHDLQLSTRSIQLLQTSITYAKTCHHLIFYMHNIASWSIWPADAAICKCIRLLVMKIEELHLFYLKILIFGAYLDPPETVWRFFRPRLEWFWLLLMDGAWFIQSIFPNYPYRSHVLRNWSIISDKVNRFNSL